MEITNSVILLQPGIYILRHPNDGQPPMTISRAPGDPAHNGRIEAIWTPGTMGATLRDGSDCIVMHVQDAPAELLVSAFVQVPGLGALPALRIDKINLDEPAPPTEAPPPSPPPEAAPAERKFSISETGVSLVGHIERVGDAVATEGDLLGDPESNLRLEGFLAVWPDRPQGVDLAYNAVVEGLGLTATTGTGHYCGSKGESRRISEVTFALIGAGAGQFALEGSAHFSGGFSAPVSSGVTVKGPENGHLTALRLNVIPVAAENPWEQAPRAKVFGIKRPAK
ncbi:hypothetical protein GCM10027277_22510 [Pseudoduganella ginsengisoli]|uniref:Uncharacterized protein n=1 Tax=Pseudoduganella ginsengisoli TaxID=1462440 RepID=A0A6L6PTC6_9BURK|nr:hypothetical protein [Pseudoduganella ginsengisoli]MTW00491.1 hypothetical protein [Pseudoduganella ginsengisoli]